MTYDPIAKLLGEWAYEVTIGSVCLRLGLAVLLAAGIGCERANKRHSAGLRTFILVAFASAITMVVDLFLIQNSNLGFPLLSACAIIGVAMLSGNSVLFSSRNQIKGLTTSAGLFACGIIGLTAGAGLYTVSLIAFVVLLFILIYLPKLEAVLQNRSNHFEIHLELKNKTNLQDFVATVRKLGLAVADIEANNAYNGSGLSVYSIMFIIESKELKKYKSHKEIIEALRSLEYVSYIEEMR